MGTLIVIFIYLSWSVDICGNSGKAWCSAIKWQIRRLKESTDHQSIPSTLTCTRLCCYGEVEGYSEQLGSGYKLGRSISKGGKGCHLRMSMIDVGTAACHIAHAEPLPTGATATGSKRKWIDLRVIVTKCLTTVAKHSGCGSGSYVWTWRRLAVVVYYLDWRAECIMIVKGQFTPKSKIHISYP